MFFTLTKTLKVPKRLQLSHVDCILKKGETLSDAAAAAAADTLLVWSFLLILDFSVFNGIDVY